MASNFVQPSECQTFTAPTGGVESGKAYLIGSLLVVATADVAEAMPFEGVVKGVFRVDRVDSEAWTEGLKIYYDESAELFTSDDDSANNPLVGVALENIDASPAVATGLVRLDGAAR